ncbi:MAG: tetratricopeptide repeat protein [Chloroflexota bacterium]
MRSRNLSLIGGALVAVGLVIALFAVLAGGPPASDPDPSGAGTSPSPAASGPAGGIADIDTRVAFWEARVAANDRDFSSTVALIDVYLERARSTGDLADLGRAQTALDRARELEPGGTPALDLREGQLHFSLHEFGEARDAAQRFLDADPGNAAGLALLGDSQLELGDEVAAKTAYDALAAKGRLPGILSRLARYASLTGHVDQAIGLVKEARDAAEVEGFPEIIAFYDFQLGELYRSEDLLDDAEAAYQQALDAVPTNVPSLGGLGRVRAAQGRRTEAIDLLEQATARLPTPALVADLGDLYALAGDNQAAERKYALVERIAEVAQATGGVYDRQLVLFLADHERDIDGAVARAESEIRRRTDVYGYDALAWALYRAGRIDEAADAASQAMRLGTPDGRILYHAGLIAAADGRPTDARELLEEAAMHIATLPPLQVPALEHALSILTGS